MSHIINPNNIGTCITVTCINHFARTLLFVAAAHKQNCIDAVHVTNAPKKYSTPVNPNSVGNKLTPTSPAEYKIICRNVRVPSLSTTGSIKIPARA